MHAVIARLLYISAFYGQNYYVHKLLLINKNNCGHCHIAIYSQSLTVLDFGDTSCISIVSHDLNSNYTYCNYIYLIV